MAGPFGLAVGDPISASDQSFSQNTSLIMNGHGALGFGNRSLMSSVVMEIFSAPVGLSGNLCNCQIWQSLKQSFC